TTFQEFGLIVTAEPYFGVSRPSDLVVMEGYVTPGTVGAQAEVEAKYQLLARGQYRLHVNPSRITELPQDPKVPLDLYEAQNAVRIARWTGADQYASGTYEKAAAQLQQAEAYQDRNAGKKPVATVARQAVQTAEDARLLTIKNREREQAANAKAAAAGQVENANAEAAAAQRQAAEAGAAQQQAETEKQAAKDELASANVARDAADAAQHTAEQQATAAQAQAHEARIKLLAQLNTVLKTRDSATGLIVDMPDVLFDLNQATLHQEAQLKLAKVAGILLAYPNLKVQVNGYTDSTGTADYNQQLSEKRATAVEGFLSAQAVSAQALTAQGFGEADPVGSNATAAGRQQNRRVELVVNGAAIGTEDPQP
ncbi:MAG TPA: OmpA family protein, partial [Terriglobales bacterium]|nr:OmpA family protein [Terriglobales bacterium]